MNFQEPSISIDKLRQGDTNTFKCLFNHLYPELFLFANSIVLDPPVAEDIVTDTFVSFWIKRWNFHSFLPIKSFLMITTKNSCFNHLERLKVRERAKYEIETLSALEENARLEEIFRREIVNDVFRYIQDLPPKCQKVMIMVYSEGLCNQKIAEIMGISKNTVRNQKKRGLQILRDRFKGRFDRDN